MTNNIVPVYSCCLDPPAGNLCWLLWFGTDLSTWWFYDKTHIENRVGSLMKMIFTAGFTENRNPTTFYYLWTRPIFWDWVPWLSNQPSDIWSNYNALQNLLNPDAMHRMQQNLLVSFWFCPCHIEGTWTGKQNSCNGKLYKLNWLLTFSKTYAIRRLWVGLSKALC